MRAVDPLAWRPSFPVKPLWRADPLPHPPVERHAEHELGGRDAGREEVPHGPVGGVLPGIGGARVEVGVVAGRLARARHAEVVGHQVDEVHDGLDLRHLRVGDEVGECARREGEQEAPPALRPLPVEGGTQVRHERGEVLLVLRPVGVAVPREPRVLPVHVEAVEVVAPHEVDRARHEHPPAPRGERRVGEALRPGPPADRDQDPQVGVVPPQAGQHLQVRAVVRAAFDDPPTHDVGEREVDVGQLLRADLEGIEDAVPGEDVGDDRRACGRLGGGRGRPGRHEDREEKRAAPHGALPEGSDRRRDSNPGDQSSERSLG